MSRKIFTHGAVVLLLALVGAQAASAKYIYSYAVKFVCGYNNTNIGISSDGKDVGEPPVKFGNYATEINIFNFNVNPTIPSDAIIQKDAILLVDKGRPVAREPKVAGFSGTSDHITLLSQQATMDDCNRIAEMLWGAVPPLPYPLTIGFLVIQSTVELDVSAVYTAQTCANWVASPEKLECLDASGKLQGASVSIDVNQVTGHKLF
jgi:hypothetical protein